MLLTIGARDRPRCPYRAHSVRIRAVCELEPVACVGFQILSLNLESEVHVVSRKGGAGINWPARKLGIVEYLEGHADRDALVGQLRPDGHSTSPKKD